MMAGLLIISVISGAFAAGTALVVAQSLWIALAAYVACGMISLLLVAAFVTLRGQGRSASFNTAQFSPVQARARH